MVNRENQIFLILLQHTLFSSNLSILKKLKGYLFKLHLIVILFLILLSFIIALLIFNHYTLYIETKGRSGVLRIIPILTMNYWISFLILMSIVVIIYIFIFTFYSSNRIVRSFEVIKKKADQKLNDVIKSYVYHQLKELENDFKTIELEQINDTVRKQLSLKLNSLIEYLSITGYDIKKSHAPALLEYCFSLGAPIIGELRELIRKHRETVLSKDLFGAQIEVEEGGTSKTIGEKIDKLLKSYEDWEILGEGKI
jgi:hypothetical protein